MNIKNETVVFTGTLITMSRKQAQALVFSLVGKIQKNISKSTTILVVGNLQGDLFTEKVSSNKIETAIKINDKQDSIKIIDEKAFFSLIKDNLYLLHSNL
ncbi:BRCT domain-containing protein [Vagococcus fluvialis]|uniref:BRCT domain-containing protein n=1 Tax=Vagococcus fluvialis TaxID=2738 RepID=UPI003B5C416B